MPWSHSDVRAQQETLHREELKLTVKPKPRVFVNTTLKTS